MNRIKKCLNHRNSLQCILPPYIADKMNNLKEQEASETINNRLRNNRLRSDRKFFSNLAPEDQKLVSIKKISAAKPRPIIEIYNCNHADNLPGTRITSNSSQDKDVKNVYRAAKYTWDFYYSIFNRNSIDNSGMALINSVHYGKKYSNAMWNGRQMVYGDGDKSTFDSFTVDIDIIGHELTHGVTQFTANLDYENQSGALNESFSDIFGIMIKQFALNEDVNKSNWLIGENVIMGDTYALRSMIEPGTAYKNHPILGDDPQPVTMSNYVKMPNTDAGDYGGVHINSGISNYAFCMAALAVGGNSWETVGKVWYAALTQNLTHNSDFAAAKAATILQAKKIFGKGSKVEKAVIEGWKKAKV